MTKTNTQCTLSSAQWNMLLFPICTQWSKASNSHTPGTSSTPPQTMVLQTPNELSESQPQGQRSHKRHSEALPAKETNKNWRVRPLALSHCYLLILPSSLQWAVAVTMASSEGASLPVDMCRNLETVAKSLQMILQ